MRVTVYKTSRKKDLYLYVSEDDGLARVPDELLEKFGPAEPALTFELTDDRTLAREDPVVVRNHLVDDGFHLQLPPAESK